MAGDDSWMRAEMGGTTRASLISKPEVVIALIKRAKRPLIIVGHDVTGAGPESEVMIGFIREAVRAGKMQVLGTSHTVRDLLSRGIRADDVMGGMEIVDRLRDPDWKGLDGQGSYDLVFLTGIPYSYCWILLSGLRNGVPDLKTVSLDRVYQPHASWSFANTALHPWSEQMQAVVALLEKG